MGVLPSSAGGSGIPQTRTFTLLADQNTRLWVYAPHSGSPSDDGAVGAGGQADIWQSTSRDFYAYYRSAGGHNGHFDLGGGGANDWGTWSQQLGAMSGDLASNIR